MKYLYRLYQLIVALPIFQKTNKITTITTMIGCQLDNGHF